MIEKKTRLIPKNRQKYDEADRKKIEKGYKAKTLLVCGIGIDEFNRVSACESAKEIWDYLKTAHEGTEQVKESKIDMLTSLNENFKMKERETIHEMFTKLSSITNELRSLGEPISMIKQVRKVLRILPKSWEIKVDAITEAKDLKVLIMDALIGNLKTHEMNRNHDQSKKKVKKDKSLMLKYKSEEDSSDDDMAYLINRFQNIALAAWGDSSSDSEDPDEPNNVSMVVVHKEETIFNEEDEDKVSERSNNQCWYMDNGCSKHMTGDIKNFVSLKTLQGGGVSFSDGKKGYILGVGKVGKSLEESIDNVYHVGGLKYSLLSDLVLGLTKLKFCENKISEAGANNELRNDNVNDNHSLSEKTDEVEKCDEGPGTTLNSSQNTSNSPENDELIEEEELADQLNQSTLRPGWKHGSSHPLDNLISPLNSGIHTR
ncbi:uncharacterized protein [Solanum lycopersicum]|uniref:uncharacterized protein n=1 Tax=Solanum lycopersicum TaxID=4081 RepID=UPI0037495AC4